MRRELGIARCGLACCLCAQDCEGCRANTCAGAAWCENRRCSSAKSLEGCYECSEACDKGLLKKIKPRAFRLFVQRYGVETLPDCLERNEKSGIVYHREGFSGDYDDFDDEERLIEFIREGKCREQDKFEGECKK